MNSGVVHFFLLLFIKLGMCSNSASFTLTEYEKNLNRTFDLKQIMDRMFSENELERIIKRDMSDNLKGSCSWMFANSNETSTRLDGSNNTAITLSYHYEPVDAQEWSEYFLARSAETRINSHILTGLYEGEDRLTPWLNSKRLHFAVPRTHPRNNQKEHCIQLCKNAVLAPTKPYIAQTLWWQPYYLMRAQDALVSSLGMVALQCGYWQGHESCLNNIRSVGGIWRRHCNNQVPRKKWPSLFAPRTRDNVLETMKHKKLNFSLPENKNIHKCFYENRYQNPNASELLTDPRRVKRIFLMTAAWDYNFHHATFEGALRLFQHIDFLRANPDVYIHMQADDLIQADRASRCGTCKIMRQNLLEFFNISKRRIIRGVVAAEQVYWSRAIHCSSPLHHPIELRKLAKTMLAISHNMSLESIRHKTLMEVHTTLLKKQNRPAIIIQDRRCVDYDDLADNAKRLVEICDERSWNETFFNKFVTQVQTTFHHTHDILVHSGGKLADQVVAHSRADIIFGLHGAGLTNSMFMRPGGLLVEIVGFWDGRILPLCGHYGPYAAVFNIHHFIYNFDSYSKYMNFEIGDLLQRVDIFYRDLSSRPSDEIRHAPIIL